MPTYPWSDKNERGTWESVVDPKGGPKSALFVCPNCSTKMSLNDHEIDEDGLVFPTVDCPSSSCGYNQYVELKGWRLH